MMMHILISCQNNRNSNHYYHYKSEIKKYAQTCYFPIGRGERYQITLIPIVRSIFLIKIQMLCGFHGINAIFCFTIKLCMKKSKKNIEF
jgi:hypothetical protein